jgi:hypothetical protein
MSSPLNSSRSKAYNIASEMMVSDVYLRGEFSPPGKARAPRPGDTPIDRYHNRLGALGEAVDTVEKAFLEVAAVIGDDGRPLVESRGADTRLCSAWRKQFGKIDEELVVWGRTFKRVYGTVAGIPALRDDAEHDDMTLFDEAEENVESQNGWDRQGELNERRAG